ncbi:MAG: hypothetical protein MHM6MM_002134 [Cercozoa sp. M6MM]
MPTPVRRRSTRKSMYKSERTIREEQEQQQAANVPQRRSKRKVASTPVRSSLSSAGAPVPTVRSTRVARPKPTTAQTKAKTQTKARTLRKAKTQQTGAKSTSSSKPARSRKSKVGTTKAHDSKSEESNDDEFQLRQDDVDMDTDLGSCSDSDDASDDDLDEENDERARERHYHLPSGNGVFLRAQRRDLAPGERRSTGSRASQKQREFGVLSAAGFRACAGYPNEAAYSVQRRAASARQLSRNVTRAARRLLGLVGSSLLKSSSDFLVQRSLFPRASCSDACDSDELMLPVALFRAAASSSDHTSLLCGNTRGLAHALAQASARFYGIDDEQASAPPSAAALLDEATDQDTDPDTDPGTDLEEEQQQEQEQDHEQRSVPKATGMGARRWRAMPALTVHLTLDECQSLSVAENAIARQLSRFTQVLPPPHVAPWTRACVRHCALRFHDASLPPYEDVAAHSADTDTPTPVDPKDFDEEHHEAGAPARKSRRSVKRPDYAEKGIQGRTSLQERLGDLCEHSKWRDHQDYVRRVYRAVFRRRGWVQQVRRDCSCASQAAAAGQKRPRGHQEQCAAWCASRVRPAVVDRRPPLVVCLHDAELVPPRVLAELLRRLGELRRASCSPAERLFANCDGDSDPGEQGNVDPVDPGVPVAVLLASTQVRLLAKRLPAAARRSTRLRVFTSPSEMSLREAFYERLLLRHGNGDGFGLALSSRVLECLLDLDEDTPALLQAARRLSVLLALHCFRQPLAWLAQYLDVAHDQSDVTGHDARRARQRQRLRRSRHAQQCHRLCLDIDRPVSEWTLNDTDSDNTDWDNTDRDNTDRDDTDGDVVDDEDSDATVVRVLMSVLTESDCEYLCSLPSVPAVRGRSRSQRVQQALLQLRRHMRTLGAATAVFVGAWRQAKPRGAPLSRLDVLMSIQRSKVDLGMLRDLAQTVLATADTDSVRHTYKLLAQHGRIFRAERRQLREILRVYDKSKSERVTVSAGGSRASRLRMAARKHTQAQGMGDLHTLRQSMAQFWHNFARAFFVPTQSLPLHEIVLFGDHRRLRERCGTAQRPLMMAQLRHPERYLASPNEDLSEAEDMQLLTDLLLKQPRLVNLQSLFAWWIAARKKANGKDDDRENKDNLDEDNEDVDDDESAPAAASTESSEETTELQCRFRALLLDLQAIGLIRSSTKRKDHVERISFFV